MKILITGSKGQLGSELQKIIKTGKAEIGDVKDVIKNAQVIDLDVEDLDITNLARVKEVVKREMLDVVINCAAATNVYGWKVVKI